VLEYISESLTRSTLTTRQDPDRHEMALQAPPERIPEERRPRRDTRAGPRDDRPAPRRYPADQPRRRAERSDDYEE